MSLIASVAGEQTTPSESEQDKTTAEPPNKKKKAYIHSFSPRRTLIIV